MLYYEIFIFYFLFFYIDCFVKHLNILFNFFIKIDLISWDKFSCNFKYIFINEIGLIFFFFYIDCLVKHLNILFNFFLKIDLISWDKFSCNFKYIFINEIGFIKKIVLVVGQINKK